MLFVMHMMCPTCAFFPPSVPSPFSGVTGVFFFLYLSTPCPSSHTFVPLHPPPLLPDHTFASFLTPSPQFSKTKNMHFAFPATPIFQNHKCCLCLPPPPPPPNPNSHQFFFYPHPSMSFILPCAFCCGVAPPLPGLRKLLFVD